MATKEELQDEIKALKKQIKKYKRKFQDEVELKRQCEEELRKREEGIPTTREWRAASVPSISSSTSSASSSASTTPQTSSDAIATRTKKKKKEKKASNDPKEKKEKKEKKKKSKTLPRGLPVGGEPAEEASERERSDSSSTASPVPPAAVAATVATTAAEGFFTVRAIETFKASSKRELSFAKGAVITVLEENEADGLFRGQLGKKEGWFPSFYVVRT